MTRTSTVHRPEPARNVKDALEQLSRPGRSEVLRGDLGLAGVPGVVFAPAEGVGLPAVAFGHDWLQPPDRYAELLRHLASWGIVAAAPAGETGLKPSHEQLATDLRTALAVCAEVRLGVGRVKVDPGRLAFAGHGIGGGAALLAAAAAPSWVAAVVTVAVTQTRPSAIDAARVITAPTLHLAAAKDTVAPPAGNAQPLTEAAGGPVWVRTLRKASHTGFLEGSHWSDLLLSASPDGRTRRSTRALVTAFLLHHLCNEDRVDDLVNGEVPGTDLTPRP